MFEEDHENWQSRSLVPRDLIGPPAPTGGREIAVPMLGGGEIEVFIPEASRDRARRYLLRRSRSVTRKSMIAGNQATLSYTLGGSIGGTLATGGIIAIATGTGTVGLAGIAITAIGALLTTVGIVVAHSISNLRARYEEEIGVLRDAAEELR